MNMASGLRCAFVLLTTLLAGASSAAAQSSALLELLAADGTPRFVVDSSGAFVAHGTYHNDFFAGPQCGPQIPATGAGTRLMWHPCKAAVRFGYLNSNPNAWDDSNIGYYSFAGGEDVIATSTNSFAFGSKVSVTGSNSAAFGAGNTVSGQMGFSAGYGNVCSNLACVALGRSNTASGQGSIALGYNVTASGNFSVALGWQASTNGKYGSMAMGDYSSTPVQNQANDEFRARYQGGFRLRVSEQANGNTPGADNNVGCDLTSKVPTWTCASSRTVKENFLAVDGEEILRRLRGVPVTTWTMIGDKDGILHLGPVAEDFYQAFGLGLGETAIGLGDIDGVNFAASQALERRTTELREEMERRAAEDQAEARAMRAEIERLRAEVAELRASLAAFEALEERLARIEAASAEGRAQPAVAPVIPE